MPGVIRDRLGCNVGRDLAEEVGREFEHRAFFVDEAVELAVGPPTEMAATRQFPDILRNSCDLQRFAVDAGVVPVGVPDKDRMLSRDQIELCPRKNPRLAEGCRNWSRQSIAPSACQPLPASDAREVYRGFEIWRSRHRPEVRRSVKPKSYGCADRLGPAAACGRQDRRPWSRPS